MYPCFDVDGISSDKLLREWQWLVTGEFQLLAVNAFGDLFLEDVDGVVKRLDIAGGKVSAIARSKHDFERAAKEAESKRDWFLENDTEQAERRGYRPGKGRCIGNKIPRVFAESADVAENLYVADLDEYVSFMGDLHQQISDVPNGGKVRIKIQPKPEGQEDAKS
ncbi:MAG TPA: hypothetical protein VFE61_17495 [Candidatus Sulfotelmatobacter sp.]|jgi:hypothetical protein|nr:hypothetical protein [Candidatus Sulfotelmatobacter sp.]